MLVLSQFDRLLHRLLLICVALCRRESGMRVVIEFVLANMIAMKMMACDSACVASSNLCFSKSELSIENAIE